MASIAGFISPSVYWPFAFLSFSLPFLFIINLLFLLLWLVFWKKEIAISIVALAFSLWHLPKFASFNSAKEKPSGAKSIRVMTYNVNLFNQYNGDSSNAAEMLHYISEREADIICLQEFFTMKGRLSELKVKRILSGYPYFYIRYTVEKNSREAKYGVAIFSKYKIVRKQSISFGPSSFNSAIYSDIKVGKDTIRVFCGHLESNKLSSKEKPDRLKERIFHKDIDAHGVKSIASKLRKAYLIRAKQVDSIRAIADATPYRRIFCGDFNDLPASYAYSQIKGTMADSYTEAGRGIRSTYQGLLPTMRIDYIFADKPMIAYKYRSPRIKYSDHYPVIVDLYFEE
jgi:Metal-dependent hydrolase